MESSPAKSTSSSSDDSAATLPLPGGCEEIAECEKVSPYKQFWKKYVKPRPVEDDQPQQDEPMSDGPVVDEELGAEEEGSPDEDEFDPNLTFPEQPWETLMNKLDEPPTASECERMAASSDSSFSDYESSDGEGKSDKDEEMPQVGEQEFAAELAGSGSRDKAVGASAAAMRVTMTPPPCDKPAFFGTACVPTPPKLSQAGFSGF